MKSKLNTKLKFFGVILSALIILSACSNPLDSLADEINSWFSDSGVTDSVKDTGSEDTGSLEDTDNNEEGLFNYDSLIGEGTETTLEEGEHTVGKDIPAGRYHVTPDDGRGNFSITSEAEKRLNFINGIISSDDSYSVASKELYVFLFDGHNIELNNVALTFMPYDGDDTFDTLPTGQYIVGVDIEPGIYEVFSDLDEYYYTFEVYTEDEQERALTMNFGDPVYGSKNTQVILLEDGDIVINNVPSVELTLID